MRRHSCHNLIIITLLILLAACKEPVKEQPLFEALGQNRTGLAFSNTLTPAVEFNMFTYAYFYNGAGIGAGDFNNDGLVDLFFAANQGNNQLYINTGNLKFRNATATANIPQDAGWSTGVSVIDINNDGLLDIYVCRVGNYKILQSKNQLLVCQGIDSSGNPRYADKANEYGLDFSGFSTQAAFLDFDRDGDLDMFLLNHSIHQSGMVSERKNFLNTYDALSGDRIYRNDGLFFTDVTKETGINSSEIGYGLGVAVADIDVDGYPDIYVGNDFHEDDYLYINQRNGTFSDEITQRVMHTSQFSMGVDVADINNDGFPEIISTDMLPYDPHILKKSLDEGEFNYFNLRINYGYNYQYARNNLQLNRRNGLFSETGMYSGVYATDWSWGPLWLDMNNDGLKDLFITNGIPKRLNDMDYVNYISNAEIQLQSRHNKNAGKDMALLDKFPQVKLPNRFFVNTTDVKFREINDAVLNNKPTYSNGAVYADFDNDGDLDIVVNNIDDAALLYENKSNDNHNQSYLELIVQGVPGNSQAVGAKVIIYSGDAIRTYEKNPVHGYMSSMEIPIHIGLENAAVDSVLLIWPDNTYQPVQWMKAGSRQTITYSKGLPQFDYTRITQHRLPSVKPAQDITAATGLQFLHKENAFVDFDQEPLIPNMLSREGPALAIADMNGDGLEDVFIGAAKGRKAVLYRQTATGKFSPSIQPALIADSLCEDVTSCWVDINNDRLPDLIVAGGGNEYELTDFRLVPRLYLNTKEGRLLKQPLAFNGINIHASCIVPYDFTGDGYMDLFIGARAVPGQYGVIPQSYLLVNTRNGQFKDVTKLYSNELAQIGFVKNALWFDIDKDGDNDLLLALEWDGLYAMINEQGKFTKKMLSTQKGWWNFILPVDIDKDGDVDIIAGNLGLNNRLKASAKEPVRLYYNDFDENGRDEQVMTYYLMEHELPFAGKDALQKQIPSLKKTYLYAKDFANASLEEIFTKEKLTGAAIFTADYFASAVLINDGHMNFSVQPLPWQAQLTSLKDAVVLNANNDDLPDILLMGNEYTATMQMGRYDAGFGMILLNKGNGQFTCENLNGLSVKGEVRRIGKITVNKREAYVLAKNNDSAMIIQFEN